ncbi:MAG: glycine cleavage system protein GcvH [bacterium]
MANIPADLKYTKTHEWVRVEGDVVTSGVTDFAQKELSDIVYVEVTALGAKVKREEPIGTIEAVKAVTDLFAAVSGEVVAANDSLKTEAQKCNQDPYGEGWIVRIKVSDAGELDSLLDAQGYAELVARSEHH